MSQYKHGTPEPDYSDGRNIDTAMGMLTGEGAQQQVESSKGESQNLDLEVWQQPASQPDRVSDPTYYDHPAIKKSPWGWDVPAYYYVGGATGASMTLGAAALVLDGNRLPVLVKNSRWIGVIGAGVSAFFLIHDLGRPSRFLYMLRVFRPTSPMSMGTYILSAFGSFTGTAWLAQLGPRSLMPLGNICAVLGGIFGIGLSGYTGVLVSNTVVPVWQMPHRVLPVLFIGSAMSSAASLFDLMDLNEQEAAVTRRFGIAGKTIELSAALAAEAAVARVPQAVKPMREGVTGFIWQAGKVCTAASLVLSLTPGESKGKRRLIGVLGTLGALCIRFGIHYAGQKSARDPRATFHSQRAGYGAKEVTGQSGITGPNGERAVTSPVAAAVSAAQQS